MDVQDQANYNYGIKICTQNEQFFYNYMMTIWHGTQSLATAVVQVVASAGQHWVKKHCGVVCFVKDNVKRSYFFRLYCPERQTLLWEHELYNQFEYRRPRRYFHTFESDVGSRWLNRFYSSVIYLTHYYLVMPSFAPSFTYFSWSFGCAQFETNPVSYCNWYHQIIKLCRVVNLKEVVGLLRIICAFHQLI